MELSPSGSQPRSNQLPISYPRAEQSQHPTHKKPQTPTTGRSPRDYKPPKCTGVRRVAWQQAQLRVRSIPGKHQCPCSPTAAEAYGQENMEHCLACPKERKLGLYKHHCSGAGKPQGPSRHPEPRFIWQEVGEHKHTGLSNWIPSDLYSIWDDNEVVNTEIQDSNKPLTFIDLSVSLNHHLVSRRWVIYSSLSRLAPRGSLGEQQRKGACERRG